MNNNSDILFEGSAGMYRSINLGSGWSDHGSLISFGSDISSLGFSFVGDLMCSAFSYVLVRSYAHLTEGTYALLLSGMTGGKLNVIGLDFYSCFADGSSLTTTTTSIARDIPGKGIHRRVYAWNGVYDLYHKHQKHLNELRGDHGKVIPVAADLLSLAESLDSFFVRQFGA
jgi:hypothetical protein